MRALERNGRSQMEARATSSIRWAKKASGCDKCAVAGGKTACASCKRVRPHSFWLSLFPIFALATDIEMRAHTREVIMEQPTRHCFNKEYISHNFASSKPLIMAHNARTWR